MESLFSAYRKGIIGIDSTIPVAEGVHRPIIYADWTASGRNYAPIEERMQRHIMPLVANTHTETSATGMAMTYAYHEARKVIKEHVNARDTDILITATSGMTRLVNKLQRMLGVRVYQKNFLFPAEKDRPVVFITHMEHHSNQTSWLETMCDVEIIGATEDGLVDLEDFKAKVSKFADRPLKIASVTACSNVTGIITPYYEIARIIHAVGGYCFVDFACSAPYVEIDMHPADPDAQLDAILFSPHKFLGGPGSAAVLLLNSELHKNPIPDNPGGGTVDWTNPWGEHKYVDDVEAREDGGTPAFLQTIKTSMCIKLKEEMGPGRIQEREHELLDILWNGISDIPNLHILAPQHKDRLPVVSFYIEDLHYNLGVRMLNDRYGIQSRGGCSCAGTYGHYLLNVDQHQSHEITDRINHGDFSTKPGWIRVSLHPTMTQQEVETMVEAIRSMAKNHLEWRNDYDLDESGQGMLKDQHLTNAQIQKGIDLAMQSPFA